MQRHANTSRLKSLVGGPNSVTGISQSDERFGEVKVSDEKQRGVDAKCLSTCCSCPSETLYLYKCLG
jgi:hypothetical protein